MQNLWDRLKEETKDMANRTNDAIESGRLKLETNSLRRQIDRHHLELGKLVARTAAKEETHLDLTDDRVQEHLSAIAQNKAEIAKLEQRMADLK